MDSIYISGKKTKIKNNKINRFVFGKRIVKRDTMYLYFAEKNRVNLNAWVNPERTVNNVGDYLSLVVVNYMCKRYGVSLEEKVKKTQHLYAIGSILIGNQNATIWGSGFISDYRSLCQKKLVGLYHRLRHSLDIRAVRGPETLRILKEMGYSRCIENKCSRGELPLGDPAVLMPLIYPKARTHKNQYVVIPNFSKYNQYSGEEKKVSTFSSKWENLIDSILDADLVISSSLHGIILAEAYGVPAVLLRDVPNDLTKYKDWYYSTNRYDFPMADSIQEALEITPSLLDKTTLGELQNGLINSFPIDLWK